MTNFIQIFDSRVSDGLVSCGVDLSASLTLGVAVSGGADSVSLLTSLSHIVPSCSRLLVVTVNHNIRSEKETGGDASFVESYCTALGLECHRYDIARGQIKDAVRREGLSLEDAARMARYECFERFISECHVDFLALAHNRGDQLETILMRFLAGGDVESLSGIMDRRDRYVRPLLGIPRADIERYLEEQGIPFRTDLTNSDNGLLRNRIRNILVPSLDEHFSGWDTALLSLAEKMRSAAGVLKKDLVVAKKRCRFRLEENRVIMDGGQFFKEEKALRVRLLFAASSCIPDSGTATRIPYSFFSRVAGLSASENWTLSCAGVRVFLSEEGLYVEREMPAPSERGFCLLVLEAGSYELAGLHICVSGEGQGDDKISLSCGASSLLLPDMQFPFIIRSRQPGDSLLAEGGAFRSVASVLDGWKCAGKKDLIPLVQRLDMPDQPLAVIWGDPLGFKNWVVKY